MTAAINHFPSGPTPRMYSVTFRGEEHQVEATYEGDGVLDWWLPFLAPGVRMSDLMITSEEHADVERQLEHQRKDGSRRG